MVTRLTGSRWKKQSGSSAALCKPAWAQVTLKVVEEACYLQRIIFTPRMVYCSRLTLTMVIT